MPDKTYEIHPAATLFPLMTEDEYQGLKADIAEHGQREDIVVWCGKLIDGRNRLRACKELGREPDIAELDHDEDPWKYVISHNLHRRHLTTSQRAMIAGKLADMKRGVRTDLVQNCSKSLDDAAKQLKVGRRTVAVAKQVQKNGSESVIQAVEQGELPTSLAAKFIKAVPDPSEQTQILQQGIAAVRQVVRESRNDPEHIPPVTVPQRDRSHIDEPESCDLNALRPLVWKLNRSQLIVVGEWVVERLKVVQ